MFKWFFIIIIIILSVWVFSRETIPNFVIETKVGRFVDELLFPMAFKVSGKEPGVYNKTIVKVPPESLSKLAESLDNSNKNAIIYFYNTGSISQRFVLRQINELAEKYDSNKVLFFIVAFQENQQRLDFTISRYKKLYFRPLITDEKSITDMKIFYAKKNINFSETPVLMYKSGADRSYKIMTFEYNIKSQFEQVLLKP